MEGKVSIVVPTVFYRMGKVSIVVPTVFYRICFTSTFHRPLPTPLLGSIAAYLLLLLRLAALLRNPLAHGAPLQELPGGEVFDFIGYF